MNVLPGIEGTPALLVDLEDVATLGRTYTPSVEALVFHANRLGIPLYAAWDRTWTLEYTEDNTAARLEAVAASEGKLPLDRYVRGETFGRCIDVADATRLIEAAEAAYAEHDRQWQAFVDAREARKRAEAKRRQDDIKKRREAEERLAEQRRAAAKRKHRENVELPPNEAERLMAEVSGARILSRGPDKTSDEWAAFQKAAS